MSPEEGNFGSPGAGVGQEPLVNIAYRVFAYFGLFSIFGSLLYGFRHDEAAMTANLGYNLVLYGIFVIPHLVMTRSWFKRALWGNPAGTPSERRVYIAVTVILWLVVLIWHRPTPGVAFDPPEWMRFAGIVFFLFAALMFFQGITFEMIDGLLGMPGSVTAYSHGPETPLFTEGAYARVRHPQYRAFILASAASLFIHPNMGQLFWAIILAGTFVAFIPVEEAQLIRARGDDYRQYMARTPWRLFRGIW